MSKPVKSIEKMLMFFFSENTTTESLKTSTIQIENDVQEIKRKGSHNTLDSETRKHTFNKS